MPVPRSSRSARSRRSVLRTGLTVVLAGLVCGALGWLASSWLAGSLAAQLGPPSGDLAWYEELPIQFYLMAKESDLKAPSETSAGTSFEVQSGDTVSSLADRLHASGWMADPVLFRWYLRYTGGDRHLVPGIYVLPPGASARAIADALASGRGRIRLLTVLPGMRAEEISSLLSGAGLAIGPQDFLDAIHRRPGTSSLYASLPPQSTLEGFLLPNSYPVDPSATADLLVFQMVSDFDQHVDANLRSAFEQQGLSLYEAVTLASIVQREVVVSSEMPMVSSVFLNRLARDMPLQSDVTVQYAIGFVATEDSWWKDPLSSQDLEIQSPFNTYLHGGLPPGPIDNPGLPALQAVAHPAQTDYLFFRAACDGSGRHIFSETYLQHLAAACP